MQICDRSADGMIRYTPCPLEPDESPVAELAPPRKGALVGAAVTRDMANAGVGILAGCDAMLAGFRVHDELVAMVRGGSPLLAISRP